MNSNLKGNIALGQAIAYFTQQGYVVNIPLNDSQWYDLIVEKDNIFYSVQVKYTSRQNPSGSYFCSLETTSGTSREVLYTIKDKPLDLLFCTCANGENYLIPVKEITNQTTVTLNRFKRKTANLSCFDTSKYYLNNTMEEQNFENIEELQKNTSEVLQYDLNGQFLNKYENCSVAARAINKFESGGATHIGEVCRGKRKSAYGFQWRYN